MNKITEVKIITMSHIIKTVPDLENHINGLISQGWQPFCSIGDSFAIVLVKYESVNNDNLVCVADYEK